jgi:hypothetical protein
MDPRTPAELQRQLGVGAQPIVIDGRHLHRRESRRTQIDALELREGQSQHHVIGDDGGASRVLRKSTRIGAVAIPLECSQQHAGLDRALR